MTENLQLFEFHFLNGEVELRIINLNGKADQLPKNIAWCVRIDV